MKNSSKYNQIYNYTVSRIANINRKMFLIVFTSLITFVSTLAQEQSSEKNEVHNYNNVAGKTNLNNTSSIGDSVTIKSGSKVLMTISEETTAGSIKLNDAGAVLPTTNKLYNNGGSLYWDGSVIEPGGATKIDELSDGKTSSSSLFLGTGAGAISGGSYNIGVGAGALRTISNGEHNIGIGYRSIYNNSNGSKNTALGYQSLHQSSGSGNVALGHQAGYYESGNNKLYIDNSSSSAPLIWGDFSTKNVKINGYFEVLHQIKTRLFQLTTGAGNGRVLTSDSQGNASWQTNDYEDNDWFITGNIIFNANNRHVGINTLNPNSYLSVGGVGVNNANISSTSTFPNYIGIWTRSTGSNGIGIYAISSHLAGKFDGDVEIDGAFVVSGGESILEQEIWIAPSLLNSWEDYGSGFNPSGYFKDSNGIVHLRGMVRNGTVGTVIFVLPVEYRPPYQEVHSTITFSTSHGRCDILSNGEVKMVSGSSSYFSLDGITFRTN